MLIATPGSMAIWEQALLDNDFAFDLETDSLDRRVANILGVSFAIKGDSGYLPLVDSRGELKGFNPAGALRFLKTVLASKKTKVAHNLQYDMGVCLARGIKVKPPFGCTQIASYDHDCSKFTYSLSEISKRYGVTPAKEFDDIVDAEYPDLTYFPVAMVAKYSCPHAENTLKLYNILCRCLRGSGQWDLYNSIDMPCVPATVWIENNGVGIDVDRREELALDLYLQEISLEREIYDIAGAKFNIRSGQQLADILYVKFRLPVLKYTNKGHAPATSKDVLSRLDHPICEKILKYKVVEKLRNTFVDPDKDPVIDGRIYTHLNSTTTRSGRLSSSGPNLQNIPNNSSDYGIREMFVPADGCLFAGADYSQIEMRLAAIISGDEALKRIYIMGEDIHSKTAQSIFGSAEPKFRSMAKTINFGVGYGMGAKSLAKRLRIDVVSARKYLNKYWRTYKGLRAYNDLQVKIARSKGYTETLGGRRRYLDDINSSDEFDRARAERIATNHPIQGTAAEVLKIATALLYKRFAKTEVKCVLTVHDELLLEAPKDIIEDVSQEQQKIMTELGGKVQFDIPLLVEGAIGKNWSECH